MIAKVFEVRDAATFVPVLAVRLDPVTEQDRYLLARAGYGREPVKQAEYIVTWGLTGGMATYDPFAWDNRTRQVAHHYLLEHFDELESGSLIDVQYILGETPMPKVSESRA